jgi:hypothetical protein
MYNNYHKQLSLVYSLKAGIGYVRGQEDQNRILE